MLSLRRAIPKDGSYQFDNYLQIRDLKTGEIVHRVNQPEYEYSG
jgi:hypothetical protein